MSPVKKTTRKNASTKKTKSTQKSAPTLAAAKAKWNALVAQNKALKKELTSALKEKAAEFKIKLQAVEDAAYAKALSMMQSSIERKDVAKKKALAAAEAKFEKQHAKKTGVKAKKTTKLKTTPKSKTTEKKLTVKVAVKKTAKKRGRPGTMKQKQHGTTSAE